MQITENLERLEALEELLRSGYALRGVNGVELTATEIDGVLQYGTRDSKYSPVIAHPGTLASLARLTAFNLRNTENHPVTY